MRPPLIVLTSAAQAETFFAWAAKMGLVNELAASAMMSYFDGVGCLRGGHNLLPAIYLHSGGRISWDHLKDAQRHLDAGTFCRVNSLAHLKAYWHRHQVSL